MNKIEAAAVRLARHAGECRFAGKVHSVYNPLEYAWSGHAEYIRRFGYGKKKVLFLGINPGPWGMVQTGVPFGEINAVRNWMRIETDIGKPHREHPKRPVEGFACEKSEVSGRRFWGLMMERYPAAESFFTDHYVANYCPLVFMEESGKNLTPDKLSAAERDQLFSICDTHLTEIISALEPEWLIGIGKFAMERFTNIIKTLPEEFAGQIKIGTVLHPSPASPAANRGWAEAAVRQLNKLGIWET